MFNEPDTSERQGGEEWNKKLLLRLEQVAHVTTTAAFALTIFLIATGRGTELNVVADTLFGTVGWAATGVVALSVITVSFLYYERHVEDHPRVVLTGGTFLALAGIGDLALNLWVFYVAGMPETVWWPYIGPSIGVVLSVGLAATFRHWIVAQAYRLKPHTRAIRAVGFAFLVVMSIVAMPFLGGISPQSSTDGVASASSDGEFTKEGEYTGHSDSVLEATIANDGYLYTGALDNEIHKVDPSSMTNLSVYTGHSGNVRSIVMGDDGYLYSGSEGNEIHKIDPSDMSQVDSYTGHANSVQEVTMGDDGYLYSASYDDQVHKIDPSNMSQVGSYTGHTNDVMSVTMGNDGYLYSGSKDYGVDRIDPSDMSQVGSYTGHSNTVFEVTMGDDGYVYSGSGDSEVHQIDPSDMSRIGSYNGHAAGIHSVTVGDDGYVYSGESGTGDNEIHRVDPSDMTKQSAYTGHGYTVTSLMMGDDGYLYSGAFDNTAHRIDPGTGTTSDPVSGTVTDRDGYPIEGAWVGADHPDVDSATTNATGYYELSVPEVGTYDVTADDGDYVSTKTVDVPGGGISGVDFALGPGDPAGQSVGLLEDGLGMFPADDTQLAVYERSTEYKSVEDGMSVDTWHEETWTKTETATFNWENRTHVDLVDGRYYRLELEGPHGHWEDSGFLYNESDMIDRTIWLEPETGHLDSNGDGTAGGSSSSGTNGAGSSTPTPTAYEDSTYPTATEQEGFGPTALGKCQTLDGQDGVEVEYWDPNYETAELEANLTTDDSTTYYIHKYFDDPRGYYRGCIADSMTDNASAEADVGLNHTALDGEGEVLTSGRQSFSAPTFGPSGKAPASTGERLGLLAGVLGALGALWIGGNRVVPASSVRSWPSETINPAFGVGAPIVTVLGLDLAGGGVISAGVATGLAQIAPFAGIVGVTVGGYAILRWIRAPPS